MARTVGSNGERTAADIRRAGIKLIFKHGFEAMSLRQSAAEVGVRPGSLYNYIASKESLLKEIMASHGAALLGAVDWTLDDVESSQDRLMAFAAFRLSRHRSRHMGLQILTHELRSLRAQPRAEMVALRSRYEAKLQNILEAGVATGEFQIGDVRIATLAILAMLTGIGMWYRPGDRLSVDKIISVHLGLILHGVAGAQATLRDAQPALCPAGRSAGRADGRLLC